MTKQAKPRGRPLATGRYATRAELEAAVLEDYRTIVIPAKGITLHYEDQVEKHGVSRETIMAIIRDDVYK